MKKIVGVLLVIFVLFAVKDIFTEEKTSSQRVQMNSPATDTWQGIDAIPEAEPRSVTCHMCHGDGVCFHCEGDGFRDGRRCSICNGTGHCDSCGGVGSLEVLEINGKDYTVCTACHGDGNCGVCAGTGRIVQQFATLGRVDAACTLCHGSGDCLGCKGTGLRELKGF